MTQRMQSQYVQFYISGSTALQLHSEEPKKAAPVEQAKPRTQKRIRICVDPVAIVGMVVALFLCVAIFVGMFQLNAVRQDVHQMEEYVVYLQHQHKSIKMKYTETYNLEDIEKTALALGMVPADQVRHSRISVVEPVVEEEPSVWENVGTFLSGLFA